MKTPELIKRSKEVISDESSKHYKQKKSLKELQGKLKKKAKKLKDKIDNEKDKKAIKKMEDERKILFAQRKKIIKVLKSLK